MEEIRSCAFTGHRPKSFSFGYDESDPDFTALRNRMQSAIVQACNAGCRRFYCGMAEGVDLWCGEIVWEMRDFYDPPLEIVAVVPFLGQENAMKTRFYGRYHRIMKTAKERYLVSRTYHKDVYRRRNQFLVDSCDALIAVYDPAQSASGTMQTVRYAEKKGKRIFRIEVTQK